MAYFRQLETRMAELTGMLRKNERWLIMCVADPDALGAGMALKRIFTRKVEMVGLAHVNEIIRPDNMAMIKYLRIPTRKLTPNLAAQYDKFALVDSQPHHHEDFKDYEFSVVIDHHPLSEEHKVEAPYTDLRPEYGATCSMLTEYLYNLGIKPGKLLATALVYGIKTDTQSFEREFIDVDVRAFRYLNKLAGHAILRKITRSEFHLGWLKYFSQAFRNIRVLKNGLFVHMGLVDNTDILVILADFFLRIHEISWTIISGRHDDRLIVILRGDGIRRDMGKFATKLFGDIGSAGGHKSMARAEIPLEKIGEVNPQKFLWDRIYKR